MCKNDKTISVYKVFLDKFLLNSAKERYLPVNDEKDPLLLQVLHDPLKESVRT